jgi:hypothetical protein
VNRFSILLLLPLFVFAVVAGSNAQASRQVTAIDRRVEKMNRQSSEFERDNMGREGKKSREEAGKRTRQIRLEIEEDLKSLQTAYNDIVVALQGGTLKPGYAVEAARSIAKHSERLKTNLALPTLEGPSEAKEPIAVSDQERSALKALAKSVYDFITNPIFEGTTALDVKESTRASHDLEAVITISHAIASR